MKSGLKYFIFRIAIIFSLLTFFSIKNSAQQLNEREEKIISEIMESWIENTESTIDYTDLRDQLEYFIRNKINLNKTSKEQLQKLMFLDDLTINAIISHRNETGDFLNIYELQTIENMDERSLYYLSFFATVETFKNISLKKIISSGKSEIIAMQENEFQQRSGFDKTREQQGKEYYLGSPYRYVLRYRFTSTNLSFGYSGEKDMGEQFFQGAQKNGFDFNSFHFILKNQGHYKTIAFGDFQANFGQGLTFGSGLAPRKSASVMNGRRNFETIRSYHSLNENEFLRGTTISYQMKKVELTGIFSYKAISTNFKSSDTLSSTDNIFSAIQLGGYHRTQSEIADRDNVMQGIYGGHLKWFGADHDVGFTAVHTFYDHSFEPGTKPYQLYNFRGTELSNVGLDFNFYVSNINFFGEISNSSNGAFAGIGGVMMPVSKTLDVMISYRNYAKDFQTTFNNAFGENADGKNEEGIYSAIIFKPDPFWQLNLYVDLYRSEWLRYLIDAPSHGNDLLGEWQFNPSKSQRFYFRYKHENKMHNVTSTVDNSSSVENVTRENYRADASYKLSNTFSAETRIEIVQYHESVNGNKNGSLIFQDLIYNSESKMFSLTGRVALFNVDDYNARVYAREEDVLHQYSVPLYQNAGVRYYLVSHFRLTKKLDGWIKYSQTTYNTINVIGTGLQQINGTVLSDLRVQFRYSF